MKVNKSKVNSLEVMETDKERRNKIVEIKAMGRKRGY